MSVPNQFCVIEPFKHHKPEYVREVAQRNGFICRTAQGTKDSEIWVKPDGTGGHWIIRLDAMGHDTRWHFGIRPHYHKNWVESDELLAKYLTRFTPEAWIYDDSGIVMGLAGGSNRGGRADQKAKDQHIPR